MGQAIFPVLAGLMWDVVKSPRWNTKVQSSVSGKETRIQFQSAPIYKWQLKYELLRASALQELQTLIGFFNARQGRFDSFLFSDPSDNAVTAHGFGVGDGATTAFQLQRRQLGNYGNMLGTFPVSTTPRWNYLLQSQAQGTTPNGLSNATIASGVSDPMGGLNAFTLTATAGSGYIVQQATVPAGIYCNSVWVRRRMGSGAIALYRPDFTGFAIVPTAAWQRFSASSATQDSYASAQATWGVNVGVLGDQVDIYFGQTEPGTTPTDPIATTSAAARATPSYYPGADGFEPVYDLAPGVQIFRQDWQGNQLLSPSPRTNPILYSTDFANAAWTKNVCSVLSGIPDPTGGTNAQRLTATAAGAYAIQPLANAAVLARTNSLWVRRYNGGGMVGLYEPGGTAPAIVPTLNWQRFAVSGGVIAGRFSGIYISTLGDAVDVYLEQVDDGPVATAGIVTVGAPVTVTDYTQNASGLITLATPPVAGAALTWSGGYYWRVRFDMDQADFQNFLYQLWEAKSISLVSVR